MELLPCNSQKTRRGSKSFEFVLSWDEQNFLNKKIFIFFLNLLFDEFEKLNNKLI